MIGAGGYAPDVEVEIAALQAAREQRLEQRLGFALVLFLTFRFFICWTARRRCPVFPRLTRMC